LNEYIYYKSVRILKLGFMLIK